MPKANGYRFMIMASVYLGIGQLVANHPTMFVTWPYEVITLFTFGFIVIYGAVTYAVLNGTFLIRLILVALLPVFAHLVVVALFGPPIYVGLLLQEAVAILIGAVVLAMALRVFRSIQTSRANEA